MTPREETGRLRTVTGTIPTSDITGPVLSHEHLQMDLRWPARPQLAASDPYRWLDEEKAVQRELNVLRKDHGLGLVVDLTCSGMGRNAAALARISAGARVAVVAGTGVFTEPFHPPFVREVLAAGAASAAPGFEAGPPGGGYSGPSAVDRLAERLLAEVGFGMDGTNSLPGVIGEIGAWGEAPTENEELCLRAAAQAARYSGLSVATYGRAGLAQLEILTSAGLAPERVAVGQQDRVDDPAQHRKIAESGGYVSFGTLGLAGEDAAAVGARVRRVLDLLEAGHADRVLLSTGVARMAQVARYGGAGFGYLFETFLPALRAAGADEATLGAILHDNPLRWLTGS
ncbi:phosphotriesterase-related protein [Actinomadura coerulea]|uniref:Phosphotriesterase-related protein n=1 Tax=Actinomadura coerulea TaxID=46159 RepID=A0A7X0KZ75_9ACTN|nr:aryldialkylphosphatase [Actinomadura coerulea]MBB6396183.1 phosphotriesterase-related protein [Actinomadura coerulea]GGQ38695.1 aryldialkylphosphatase [Actinomadura coerulea]